MQPLADVNIDEQKKQGFANPIQNVQSFGLEKGMKVADLGAGSGHYALAMAILVGDPGRVYAVDVQKDLLGNIKSEADKRNLENIEVVWGNIEQIGGTRIVDELLDTVLVSNTLFQAQDKSGLLQEAGRILKHGGTLVIIDWSESFAGMGPPAEAVVSKEQALDLAERVGFTFKEEFKAGAHHYGIIFVKN